MTTPLEEMVGRGKQTVRRQTEQAFEKGIEHLLSEAEIKRWILERLEAERQAMLNRLMGIERSFGEIRPSKDGLFTQVLEPQMRELLQQIIQEDFPDIIKQCYEQQRKKLGTEFKKRLEESFRSKLQWELDRQAREFGEALAKKVVSEMRGEMKL